MTQLCADLTGTIDAADNPTLQAETRKELPDESYVVKACLHLILLRVTHH